MARIGSSGTGGASGLVGLTDIQVIVGGDGAGSHATLGSFSTIQAAINSIPAGSAGASIRTVYSVLIPPGTYDEDLAIDITNRHIELVALGAVNIGLFNNAFWAASNTRNITITCSAGTVDSIRSTFGMGTFLPHGLGSTTHPAYSTAFRLSGSIIYNMTVVPFTDIDSMISADIFGDIDSSSTATHNIQLFLTRCHVRGQIKGTRNRIQLADYCTFTGLVTCNSYSTIRNSSFAGGMTVGTASSGGFNPFGMVGTYFAGTFTGPASSMVLDSTSNYYFVANGATLAGGATQVIIENGAGGGISQLTGDVTAGPGSGSQAATVAKIQGTTVSGTTGTTNVVFSASPTLTGTAIIPAILGNTAAVSSAGGNVTWGGAPGDSTGAGGAGGNATVAGGAANGDNTASKAGGNIVLTGGLSKGSSSGGNISGTAGTGGVGTATAGATGGNISWTGGTGGVGSATSANGGTATLTGGTAGAGTVPGNGGATTVTGGAAAAVSASAGGSTTVSGASGTSTGTGGAGGSVTITGAAANGDGTVDRAGGSVTINGGGSKGSAAGGGFTVNLGTGGAGTGSAGATGGTANINGGTGGIGSATSGAGGNATLKAGTGGAGTGGGNGGSASLTGGTAGAGSSTAGNGGTAAVSGGSSASFSGSAGGAVTVAGAGGTGTTDGGAGGNVTITGGAAGGDNTVNRNGGNITATAGNSKGSSTGGTVTLNAGVGGVGTATTGANGGAININAGNGGVGSATGGAGADLTISAGAGGSSGTPGAGGNIIFRTATTTSLTEHLRVGTNGDVGVTSGNLKVNTVAFGLQVKSGANGRIGQSTLVGGTVTVANTSITATSRIFLTVSAAGGTQGFLRTTKSAGVSFTITSTSILETSVVDWFIVESI